MHTLTTEQLKEFQKLKPAVQAMLSEFGVLRGADAAGAASAVSEVKQRAIINITSKATEFLGDEAPYVDISDLDETQFNCGDVTVLLGQWNAALHSYRLRRTVKRYGKEYWAIKDGDSNVTYNLVDDSI